MKLKWIEVRRLRMTMKSAFETSFGREQDKDFLVVSVSDGTGTGWGECVASADPLYNEETTDTAFLMLRDHIAPRLWGEMGHADEVGDRLRPIRRNAMAKSAVEGAVWDLHAKREGVSLASALGGVEETVPVGISIGIEKEVGALLDQISLRLHEGYSRIKVKIKPGWDVRVVEKIRETFGEIPLMVDANSAYTLADRQMLKALDQFGLTMIEQPLAHDDIIDHAVLQEGLETPICLDESIHSAKDAEKAIRIGACRVINIKIGRLGGLSESRKTVEVCRDRGVGVWCGGMLEAGIGRAHNLAITALPGFAHPGDTAATSRYWEEDITEPPVVLLPGGRVQVPRGPGIGVEIVPERLERFTVGRWRWDAP